MSLTPAPSPSTTPDRDAYILAIAHLSTLTDVPFDRERATQAVDNALRSSGDPLELLTAAAEEVCLHIAPTRTTIADAVWKANVNMPIIAWSPTENR
jgi:hypothetical protein